MENYLNTSAPPMTQGDVESTEVSMRNFLPPFDVVAADGDALPTSWALVPRDQIVTTLGLLADIRACQESPAIAIRDAKEGILTCDANVSRIQELLDDADLLYTSMVELPGMPALPTLPAASASVASRAAEGSVHAFRCDLAAQLHCVNSTRLKLIDFLTFMSSPKRATAGRGVKRRVAGDLSTSGSSLTVPLMGVTHAVIGAIEDAHTRAQASPVGLTLSNYVSNVDWWSGHHGRLTIRVVDFFCRTLRAAASDVIVLDPAIFLYTLGGPEEDAARCTQLTNAYTAGYLLTLPVISVVPLQTGAFAFIAVTHPLSPGDPGSILVAHPLGTFHECSHEVIGIAEMVRGWLQTHCGVMGAYHTSCASRTLATPATCDIDAAAPYSLAYAYFYAVHKRLPTNLDISSDAGIRTAVLYTLTTGKLLRPSPGEAFASFPAVPVAGDADL